MAERLTGGCFCGAVRFEAEGPEKFACFCHCHSCQHAAGAPVVAWATYPRDTFRVSSGELHTYSSSPGVTRGICAACGTSISYEHVDRPGDIGERVPVRDLEIPEILDVVAQRAKALAQAGNAQGGGAHVDAAPAGPEVERDADNPDIGHRNEI